jgi:hypothetical protein
VFDEEAFLGLPDYNHEGLEWVTNKKKRCGIRGNSSLSLQPMLSSYNEWTDSYIQQVRFAAEAFTED